MLSRLRIHWSRPETEPADGIRREWDQLLASATSPQERDEINDVFARSLAA